MGLDFVGLYTMTAPSLKHDDLDIVADRLELRLIHIVINFFFFFTVFDNVREHELKCIAP